MAFQRDKAKRWRPSFSIRTLAVVMTVACLFLASLDRLTGSALRDMREFLDNERVEELRASPRVDLVIQTGAPRSLNCAYTPRTPYIFAVDEAKRQTGIVRGYYFWFFGSCGRVPIGEAANPMASEVWRRKQNKTMIDYLQEEEWQTAND